MAGLQKIRMMNKGDDVLQKPLRRKAGSGDRVVTAKPMDYVHVPAQLAGGKQGSQSFLAANKSNHRLPKKSKSNMNDILL